jgi:hypothetical protein
VKAWPLSCRILETRGLRGKSDEKFQRLGRLFIPEVVDQRTLQICHVKATHYLVAGSIDGHN